MSKADLATGTTNEKVARLYEAIRSFCVEDLASIEPIDTLVFPQGFTMFATGPRQKLRLQSIYPIVYRFDSSAVQTAGNTPSMTVSLRAAVWMNCNKELIIKRHDRYYTINAKQAVELLEFDGFIDLMCFISGDEDGWLRGRYDHMRMLEQKFSEYNRR